MREMKCLKRFVRDLVPPRGGRHHTFADLIQPNAKQRRSNVLLRGPGALRHLHPVDRVVEPPDSPAPLQGPLSIGTEVALVVRSALAHTRLLLVSSQLLNLFSDMNHFFRDTLMQKS